MVMQINSIQQSLLQNEPLVTAAPFKQCRT
jgi:hypothetical protein